MKDFSNRHPSRRISTSDECFKIEIEEIMQFKDKIALTADFSSTHQIYSAFLEASEALLQSIEKRDPYMAGHTKRVVALSETIAHYLQLNPGEKQNLKIAALLHDIGKIGVEERILAKQDKLTEAEYKEIQKHPLIGVEIIGNCDHLKDVIPGMCYHHERTDGNGYPEGLKDANIPLLARIIAVADAYDAMTTNRPYQTALQSREAIAELQRCTGVQFDEQVVSAFIQAHENGEIPSDS